MSLQPGMQVGDYQILRELGAGGMGKVFQVRNVISDRIEAMKVLLPDLLKDQALADRFLREIKVQAALDHPNIAGLRTAMREGNQLLMIMEYVEGHTVDAYMAQGPIPIQNAVETCMKTLEALDYAHSRGIVHRDIKPSNIMITNTGVVKLMDFGIARVMNDPSLTQANQTTGSLYYMSPEQINGAPLDGRSDLYSLAISLYQMITGHRPFDGTNTFSIMAAHLNQRPVPPVQHDPRIPAALSDVILHALAKDPNQRYADARDFHAALAQSLQAPAAAAFVPPPQVAAAPPPNSSRGIYMVAGSLATIAVLAGLAIYVPKFLKARAQNPVEQPAAQPAEPQPQQPADPSPGVAQTPATTTPKSTPGGLPMAVPPQQRQQQQTPATPVAQSDPAPPPVTQPPVQQQQTQAQYQPPPAKPAIDQGAVNELRTRMVQMAQRYATAKTAYESLRQSMARQGLSPRADLGSSSQRVAFEMDQAEAALNSGNIDSAKQHLGYAERALEAMEKALNL
jgi:serine/threonine-protein kinase